MSGETDRSRKRVLMLLERLGRLMQSRGHELGLKPVQWEALRYLSRANRFSRTPSGLTAYLGSTKGTVSQTLIALESKGLIRKKSDPGDRRAVRLELTAAGRRALGSDPLLEFAESVGALGKVGEGTLERNLTALLTERLEQIEGRPFGICRTCTHFEKNAPEGKPHRCGLLELPLSADESEQICVEQES
ncbi:hypothetical protein ABI59_17285 [Acidobacteria bacterium Mor1]|nr:hypothetical protein ABI59_17285 [Acidobacteria bacterium Mor1]